MAYQKVTRKDKLDREYWDRVPILGDLNGIRRLWTSDCSVPALVWVETFFPAATITLLEWADQFTGIAMLRSGYGRASHEFIGGILIRKGVAARTKRTARGCHLAPRVERMNGTPPFFSVKNQFGGITGALFKLDARLFRALFWFSVVEFTVKGAYKWMSMAHTLAHCKADPINGPFTTEQIRQVYNEGVQAPLLYKTTGAMPSWVTVSAVIVEKGYTYNVMATTNAEDSPISFQEGVDLIPNILTVGGHEGYSYSPKSFTYREANGKTQAGIVLEYTDVRPLGISGVYRILASVHARPKPGQTNKAVILSGGTRVVSRS